MIAHALYETQMELHNYFQMWLIRGSFIGVPIETLTRHLPIQTEG
jgi:hypothetical protein